VGFDAGPDEFYHDYAIVNVNHTDRHIEGLRFVFVELPKFKPQTIKEKKMAVLWLKFLTEIDESTEEVDAELLENPDTAQALQILEKSAYDDSQLYAYEYFWDAVVNERVAIEGGYKRGMADGEHNKALEAARRMKADSMPAELIAKYTGLSIDTVNNL
jgi:predicted transposase/invertase (TIGR01784 family)